MNNHLENVHIINCRFHGNSFMLEVTKTTTLAETKAVNGFVTSLTNMTSFLLKILNLLFYLIY